MNKYIKKGFFIGFSLIALILSYYILVIKKNVVKCLPGTEMDTVCDTKKCIKKCAPSEKYNCDTKECGCLDGSVCGASKCCPTNRKNHKNGQCLCCETEQQCTADGSNFFCCDPTEKCINGGCKLFCGGKTCKDGQECLSVSDLSAKQTEEWNNDFPNNPLNDKGEGFACYDKGTCSIGDEYSLPASNGIYPCTNAFTNNNGTVGFCTSNKSGGGTKDEIKKCFDSLNSDCIESKGCKWVDVLRSRDDIGNLANDLEKATGNLGYCCIVDDDNYDRVTTSSTNKCNMHDCWALKKQKGTQDVFWDGKAGTCTSIIKCESTDYKKCNPDLRNGLFCMDGKLIDEIPCNEDNCPPGRGTCQDDNSCKCNIDNESGPHNGDGAWATSGKPGTTKCDICAPGWGPDASRGCNRKKSTNMLVTESVYRDNTNLIGDCYSTFPNTRWERDKICTGSGTWGTSTDNLLCYPDGNGYWAYPGSTYKTCDDARKNKKCCSHTQVQKDIGYIGATG
jgi:hypothetical protein